MKPITQSEDERRQRIEELKQLTQSSNSVESYAAKEILKHVYKVTALLLLLVGLFAGSAKAQTNDPYCVPGQCCPTWLCPKK